MHYMSMSYIYNIYYLYNNPYQKKALWRTFRQVCRKLFSANVYNANEFAARLPQTVTMQMRFATNLPQPLGGGVTCCGNLAANLICMITVCGNLAANLICMITVCGNLAANLSCIINGCRKFQKTFGDVLANCCDVLANCFSQSYG